MQRQMIPAAVLAALLVGPTAAQAYIGPSLGVGMIAAVLGTFAALAMAVVALVWYPVKRLVRRTRAARRGDPA